MNIKLFFRSVRPALSALALILTALALVSVIVFTEMDYEWVLFLAGVLVAATLSLASQASYSEWVASRRMAK